MDCLSPLKGPPSKDVVLDEEALNVRLQPLNPYEDCAELFKASSGANEVVWTYMPVGPFATEVEFMAYLQDLVQTRISFVVFDKPSQQKIGIITYLSIVPEMRRIEIGGIWYTPKFQRTYANTQACYLMIKHAFEDLKYRRVEWKCNNENDRSRNAALRLGFTFEAFFRQHMIVKGKNRDTAFLSIIDGEWPEVKKRLHDIMFSRK